MAPFCENCRFFWDLRAADDGDDSGLCRRNAPQAVTSEEEDNGPWATWPKVHSGDWCGEHEPS